MINQYGLTLEVPSAFFLINNTFGNTLFVAPELVNAYARPCLQKSYSTLTITTDLKCLDYYNFYEFHQTMPKTKRELFFQFNNILDPCIVKRSKGDKRRTIKPTSPKNASVSKRTRTLSPSSYRVDTDQSGLTDIYF